MKHLKQALLEYAIICILFVIGSVINHYLNNTRFSYYFVGMVAGMVIPKLKDKI